MRVYLGIDGGGSTCRARAVDASGRVIGQGVAGPANVSSDAEGARAAVLAAAGAALKEVPLGDVYAGLGLAGANDARAAAALQAALPFGRARVVSDGHVSALGALGRQDGIVAAIGTGSIFIRQIGGQQKEIGGRGLVLGDEASGAWLGRRLLACCLRAEDGFRAMTPLLAEVLAEMGGAERAMGFSLRARPADFAALAPRLTASDDPAARDILAQAGADCLEAVGVLQEGRDLPVVCLGGLAGLYAPVLAERFRVIPPLGTALDGAVALARSLDA